MKDQTCYVRRHESTCYILTDLQPSILVASRLAQNVTRLFPGFPIRVDRGTRSYLVFYVQLHVKPEYVQDCKDAVVEVIGHMSRETTYVTCYLHQDAEDADRFTLYEK
jgi:hypothetical protein